MNYRTKIIIYYNLIETMTELIKKQTRQTPATKKIKGSFSLEGTIL